MSYKMLWEDLKESMEECLLTVDGEEKFVKLSTLLELMNEKEEAAGGKKWYNGEIGYDIPITIVGVIGALLMGAGLFALVLQVYGL
nr:hypothetical protein MZNIZDYX_MZNIZDYX_CDS_0038 [uncultured phage]